MFYQNFIRSRQGFTLIEVLVVSVLLAVITAIAIPLLRDNVIEAYVPEAEAVLASISTAAERCRLIQTTYTGCTLENFITDGLVDTNSTNKWTFAFAVDGANPTSKFTATANGVTTNKDMKGKTITLTYDRANVLPAPRETKTYNF